MSWRGNLYADDIYVNDGIFKGTVQATDFLDPSGNSMLTADGKFNSDYLDLMGINIVDDSGNTIFSITDDGIRWSSSYSPIKYQYSSDNANWHNDFRTTDKYRRESYDGGDTWSAGYQFVGKDGVNGSDANVTFANIQSALQKAAATETTFITADELGAPNIYGGNIYGATVYANEFNIYPEDETDEEGSLNIHGMYGGDPYHFLTIEYNAKAGDAPGVIFDSPDGGFAYWNFPVTYATGTFSFSGAVGFSGTADFSLANVKGLTAVWG